jgi:hypothetical protein
MPFIFLCSQCGSVLYKDPSPLLQDGSYKSPTYFETVLMKLGHKCPSCGHELHVPPSRIEIFAPKEKNHVLKTRRETIEKRQTPKDVSQATTKKQRSFENNDSHFETLRKIQ